MHLINNRLIALFVAFTVAFSSIWVMSPNAIADAIKQDTGYFQQQVQQQAQQQTQQNQTDDYQVSQNQTCNHGCLMAFHLLGLAANLSINVFAFNEAAVVFSHTNHFLEDPLLQGPYRPPLTLS